MKLSPLVFDKKCLFLSYQINRTMGTTNFNPTELETIGKLFGTKILKTVFYLQKLTVIVITCSGI